MKYIRLWWLLSGYSFQIAFHSRFSAGLFLAGKVIRFVVLLLFFLLLFSRTRAIAGYSFWQIVFFYCTFNLLDIVAQFFLREVYRFRSYIITGSFDYILSKPFPPLFRVLFGGSDVLDLITLFPLLLFMWYVASRLPGITLVGVLLYVLLVINGFFIALGFHIMVVAFGILTTEVDNAIWVFRDLTQLGRIPIDVYREPVSFILTFILPIAAMITFPAKALFGLISPLQMLISLIFTLIFLSVGYSLWRYALRQYASASS